MAFLSHVSRFLCVVAALLLLGSCTDTLQPDPSKLKVIEIPNGRLIYTEAVDQATSQIVSIKTDSSDTQLISSGTELFSKPQNGKIVFVDGRVGNGEIVLANADGSNPQTVSIPGFLGVVIPGTAVLSPDASQIAFSWVSLNGGDPMTYLSLANVDGSYSSDAITDRFDPETSPVFSPDGKHLAMYLYSDNLGPNMERLNKVAIVDLPPTSNAPLDTLQVSDFHSVPSQFAMLDWSSDSKRLLYHSEDSLFIYDMDAQQSKFLTFGTQGVFSPDDQQIAFVVGAYEAMKNSDLYVINADGTARKRITETLNTYEILPSWSSDGNWILVGAYSDGATADDVAQLHAISMIDHTIIKRYGKNVWRGFWLE